MANKEDMDSFWDIDKLIPHKKTSSITPFSTKEKTVTVTIAGDESENDAERKLTLTDKTDANAKADFVYYPNGTLIKKVTVKHVPDKFDFHANFKKAAELYFDFKGTECPFAPFYSFMPQYTQLTLPQKNYYFYWRSMVRRGSYIKTEYSYLYLYAYEVINLPELIAPKDGIKILVSLWKNYRKSLPNIDANMAVWIQDYCLVYNLPLPMEEINDFIFDIMNVTRFKEFYFSGYESFGADGTGAIIAYLSDYDWRRGKYAGGDNKEAYTKHLMGAMGLFMEKILEVNNLNTGAEAISVKEDSAFRMALTTCPIKYRIKVEYRRISEEPGVRAIVTAALKYTENKLRALMGVKSRLAVKELDREYTAIIDAYFEKLFEKVNRERIKANRPEYERLYEAESEELSLSGADEIERASWQTTARLVVEEEDDEAEEAPVTSEPLQNTEDEVLTYGLSADDIAFISAAYDENTEKMRQISESSGLFPDAVADKVNEAFADNFGDVILEDTGDGYAVISDYREDVKQWLTKITK